MAVTAAAVTGATRITRKAIPSTVTKPRAKPTERQRNLRSERTNIRLKGEVQKSVRQESNKFSRENREAVRRRVRESSGLRRTERQEANRQRSELSEQRNAASIQRSRENVGIRRKERLQRRLIEEPTIGALKSGVSSSIILVIVLGFSLIILYAIITKPGGVTGALGGFSNTIAAFTQTGPMFTKVAT